MLPTNHYNSAQSSQQAAESSSAFQYGSAQPRATDPIGLEEEMPPAYTPSADTYHGETTVEGGPHSPFRPRPSHSTHRPSHSHSSSQSHSSHTTSSSSRSQLLSPSQQRPQQPLWPAPSSLSAHPGQQSQSRRGGGLVGALIGTVRGAVDAVSSIHDEHMRTMQQSQVAYVAPYPTSSSSGMAQSTYTPSYQGGQGPFPGIPPAQPTPLRDVPDDGSPTRTPAPGHPLLNNGQILIYPNKDYICVKCKNTGYKDYDPSHPCRKCWEKYGKPYAGALTYTSWSTESSSRSSKFQRALPRLASPQASQPLPQFSSYTGRPPHAVPPQAVPPQAPTPYGQHLYVYNPIIGMGQTPPVPHAVPVRPGDPRLGGQMCWKCRGTGTLPLLIIDVRPCSVCGGIGRDLR